MRDPFILECSGLPAGARVMAFDGIEEISTTYRYEIDLLVDPDADLGDAVGSPAKLIVNADSPQPTVVHGILGSASVVDNLPEVDVYRVVLIPRVREVIGLDRHSRVFVGETVPAIVQTLLREAGLGHEDCEFRLSRSYDPIDFACQYRESTLDFLMRWMERDGIYYHFAHDGTRERMVIVDDRGQHPRPRVTAMYARTIGAMGQDGLRRFRAERHAVPGRVHVDDYDYLRPALPVQGTATVPGGGSGELRVRGAKVTSPKEAERIAKLRAEGLRARQTVFHGDGILSGVHAGELFTLSGHPRASLDGDYLVTKLRMRGYHQGDFGKSVKDLLAREHDPEEGLRVEIQAIWGEVQFRPELKTPTPRVYSMEGGVIEGDVESDYAQLDEHGRYLVKFYFDERDGRGSKASARIRMMQPHAGSPEGMHFPLRKGTEVLVAFMGGDPDRPVIAGAVPNALTPAVVHSGHATKNLIHTGGGNRVQIEDSEGAQHIHLRTPHKNTYLHLGAPFNPHYTKTTSTDGTSMSFTRDISTSVTGTDAQTLVEDSRITIIGRAQMLPADTTGVEIKALVGPGFIESDPGDFDFASLAADVKQAISDFQALATANEKVTNLIAKPATDLDMAAAMAALQSATKTALADLTTLQTDADRYKALADQHPPPANFDPTVAGPWLTDVGTALGALNTANNTVNPSSGTADPALSTAAVANAFPSAQTALGTDGNFVPTGHTPPPGPPKVPKTFIPLPSPNVTPAYIAISHPDWQRTTLDSNEPPQKVDDWVNGLSTQSPPQGPPIETSDTTALDVLDTDAYPGVLQAGPPRTVLPTPDPSVARETGHAYALSSGSDVKIVGGDNVTLAAHDARSHTLGHAYGLVQAGQTSVVYAPSKYPGAVTWWAQDGATKLATYQAAQAALDAAQGALASFQSANDPPPQPSDPNYGSYEVELAALEDEVARLTLPRDAAFAALAPLLPDMLKRPSPVVPVGWALKDIAQTSATYGNVRSWIDGSVDQHITGDKSATIDGTVRTVIHGDQHTTLTDGGNAVTSEVHGTVNAYVLGSRSAEIVGSDASVVVGSKAGLTVGAETSACLGVKTSAVVGLKMDFTLAGIIEAHATYKIHTTPSAVEQNMTRVYTTLLSMYTAATALQTHEVFVNLSALHNHL